MERLIRRNLGLPARTHCSGGLLVSATDYPGEGRLPLHEHADAYLCLVAAGTYLQSGSADQECHAGMLLVHPLGHRHANRFAAHGARCLSLFLPESVSAHGPARGLLSDHRRLRLPDAQRLRARIEHELRADDDVAALAMQSAVFELIAAACRDHAQPIAPHWIARVLERLHDDPSGTPSLTELATLANVHPAHLARRFRAHTGCSVGDYQRRLRIDRACVALRDRTRSIAAVATEAGFADQSHFARVFRRLTGSTPRDFRRRAQISS